MAVLVFAENWEGKFKKTTFEAVSYAFDTAKKLNTEVVAIIVGVVADDELNKLKNYGANKMIYAHNEQLKNFITKPFTDVLAKALEDYSCDVVILPHSFNGKALAARLAARVNGGLVSGVVEGVQTDNGFVVKKAVYSGKGFAYVKVNSDIKILTISINSFGVHENDAAGEKIEFNTSFLTDSVFNVEILEQEKVTDKIPLTEAEIVVSGGRGMKGPENWGMLEELADHLGAATACSKPVSDMGWRPHSEHVGQTGITISPNLYVAIGISGAIQHQAGVNSSKIIVVINKDPEAPFFKIADYGIVGDAFDVVPKLNAAAKEKLN